MNLDLFLTMEECLKIQSVKNAELNTITMSNKEWKVESFKVQFKPGYSWGKTLKEQVDRYEGDITFSKQRKRKLYD